MSRSSFIESVSELDGRSDQHIKSYYIETDSLRRIRATNATSLGMIGLKGSGKTTLFRLLTEDWIWEPKTIRVGISPDKSEFEGLVEQLNCLQFAGSVRQGMMLLVLQLIDENPQHLPADGDPKWGAWLKRKAALLKPGSAALDLLDRFRGVTILGCGVEIGDPTESREGFRLRRIDPKEDQALGALLSDFSQFDIRLRIVVDDPDRLFTRSGKADPHLLAGYILGTNEISKRFPFVQFVHILKSDVARDLNEIEEMANLPDDYFDYISWSTDEFEKLLEARLKHAELAASEVCVDSLSETVGILADQIRNGPRDLLRYIEIILKLSDSSRISLDTIASTSSRFKRAARRQMQTIYAASYEGIEPFLAETFKGLNSLNLSKFTERFLAQRMASKPTGLDYSRDWLKTAERAFRALIEAGTVDVQTDEGWKRPYEAGYFLFDPADGGAIRRNTVFL